MAKSIKSVTSDDFITYKEENGIVYGYLNQMELDTAIINRTYNYGTKAFDYYNLSSLERSLRTARLDYCHKLEHTVRFKPILDSEYVSRGNVIIVLGLNRNLNKSNNTDFSNDEYKLYSDILIYSKYDGYFTNCIKDKVYGSSNLGNTIKDGDLLFTIQLAPKPKKADTSIKDVVFSYNMLSRDFLEKAPCIKDVSIGKWFVGNYTKVEEGDDILEITEFKSLSEQKNGCIIKTPFSGLLVKRFNSIDTKLKKGFTLFSVFSDEAKIKDSYPNEITVSTDDFTKSITIVGRRCGGSILGFRLHNIYLNVENIEGKNFLLLTFERKDMNLNKKCSMHLLLSDDSVITLNAEANPIKSSSSYSEIKFKLSPEDMIKLENEKFVKWRITNEEGVTLHSGNNYCCCVKDDASGFTKNLSYEVFQDFIKDFNKAVRDNIPEEQREEMMADNNDNKEKSSCYVYLMIDTTNNFHKIGISNHPRYREHTLQSDKPTIELLCAKEYPSREIAKAIESSLHNVYANKRIRGEWFNLDASDVENIKQTLK